MKIAIIDTDHYFYIYTLIRLFEQPGNEIVVYTNPKVYKRCKIDQVERHGLSFIVQDDKESWGDFLKRNADPINEAGYRYVFLCPIYNFYKEHYQFIAQLKTLNILVVFNLNGWIDPPLTKLRWFWNSWYKRKIIQKLKWIAIDEHFHDHAIKLGCKNQILHIPSILYDPELISKREAVKNPVKIIIPGSIDKERRDYDVVLDALSIVLKQRQDLEAVLLGDPIAEYGKQIRDKAKKINETYGKEIIKSYNKEYNDAEFLKQIVSGHFLIAPLLPEFKLDGITEIYGISKSTGSCFDILAYAIPGVFPSWLSVNTKFNSSILRYTGAEDLSKIILDLIEHPEKIEQLRANAVVNSSYYSVEKVRERLFKSLPEATP
jgi:glycosyltransferase involved in cell wall biosynthesis